MYLNTETQGRILDRFHFALSDGGFLFLGKAETLLTYTAEFVPVDLKRRVFAKVGRGTLCGRIAAMARAGGDEPVSSLAGHARAREAAFDSAPVAQLVVDAGGTLALANERARAILGIARSDLGRPLQDLPISYRPAELRSCIGRASADRAPVVLKDVEWSTGPGESSVFEVHVVPLVDPIGSLLGANISFLDTTAARRIAAEHERSTREPEADYEELQSTNEERETMNEELQSTNEELETVNEELRERGQELRVLNTFLELILTSFRGGVVVVGPQFLVQTWNRKAEDLWGLRFDEVRGKNLLGLDIGLPVERLKPLLLNSQSGDAVLQRIVLEATNRRGRPIACRVTCTPMAVDARIKGTVILMEDDIPATDGDGEPDGDGVAADGAAEDPAAIK
jgi:two-component system CheB/CheR fusion protein